MLQSLHASMRNALLKVIFYFLILTSFFFLLFFFKMTTFSLISIFKFTKIFSTEPEWDEWSIEAEDKEPSTDYKWCHWGPAFSCSTSVPVLFLPCHGHLEKRTGKRERARLERPAGFSVFSLLFPTFFLMSMT